MQLREFWRKLKDMSTSDRYIVIDEEGDPQFVITSFSDRLHDDTWLFDENESEEDDEPAHVRAERDIPSFVYFSKEKEESHNDGMDTWDAMMDEVGTYGMAQDATASRTQEEAAAPDDDEPIFQFEPVDDERV